MVVVLGIGLNLYIWVGVWNVKSNGATTVPPYVSHIVYLFVQLNWITDVSIIIIIMLVVLSIGLNLYIWVGVWNVKSDGRYCRSHRRNQRGARHLRPQTPATRQHRRTARKIIIIHSLLFIFLKNMYIHIYLQIHEFGFSSVLWRCQVIYYYFLKMNLSFRSGGMLRYNPIKNLIGGNSYRGRRWGVNFCWILFLFVCLWGLRCNESSLMLPMKLLRLVLELGGFEFLRGLLMFVTAEKLLARSRVVCLMLILIYTIHLFLLIIPSSSSSSSSSSCCCCWLRCSSWFLGRVTSRHRSIISFELFLKAGRLRFAPWICIQWPPEGRGPSEMDPTRDFWGSLCRLIQLSVWTRIQWPPEGRRPSEMDPARVFRGILEGYSEIWSNFLLRFLFSGHQGAVDH